VLVGELEKGNWYIYEGKHIVVYHLSYERADRWWSFSYLSKSESPFGGFELLEYEVYHNVEYIHPTLNQYLLLFLVKKEGW